jgi:steroid 5-alpha reductase family enzyme
MVVLSEALIVSFLAAQAFFFLIFLLSVKLDKYSTVDIFWGLSIVFNALILSLFFFNQLTYNFIFVSVGVFIWGVRLSYHLGRRNLKKPEDFRYVDMRKKWGSKIKRNAYLKVFITQGFFSFLMSLALVGALLINRVPHPLWILFAGLIYLTGLVFESLADSTLAAFKKDPENKGKICDKSVWSLSRHPNYFGEILLWWSYPLLMLGTGFSLGVFLALFSALIITWLLVFVSGVPLLEKKYQDNKAYQDYMKKTPKLIPFTKKRDPKIS